VFWLRVGNVQLAKLPDAGVPRTGATSVGLVANTKAPEPVSPVTAEARLADDGVAKNVATPVPKPETPVEIGRPVAFVSVPDAGVPRAGATSVALSDNTLLPEPVEVVTPVPPLATERVPVVPATIGRPVALVKVAEEGVPSAGVVSVGVVSVGLVAKTNAPEPVSSVTAEAKLAEDGVAKNVATFVPSPEIPVDTGKPVAFVSVPEAGVPSTGAVSVGLAMVGEIRWVFCWVKFVPSLHTVITLPAGMATVVPPDGVVLPIGFEFEIVAVYAEAL
jgi:hypothetical protein